MSSILVDTGHGLALFDGDLPESAPQIEAHIRALGFHGGSESPARESKLHT